MMRIRSRAIAALTVSVAALLAGGTASAAAAKAPRAASPSYLFSIPSGSGSLTGPDDEHLRLRLRGARDYLTRFTDRPLRQATVVADVDFARRFKADFAEDDPNAVLTYVPRGAHVPVSVVLTVGAPRWDARRATWTFSATRIPRTADDSSGPVRVRPPAIPDPRSFTHGSLLIDGSNATAAIDTGDPIELTGGGVAASLGGFLHHLFTTGITRTAGEPFAIALSVGYTSQIGAGVTALVPVTLLPRTPFDPATDAGAAPSGPLCALEAAITAWHDISAPLGGQGPYVFDLVVYGSGRAPIAAATLDYTVRAGGLTSPGCG
jgi:hypothetical protein